MKIAICGCRTAKKRLKFAAGGVADLMHFNAGRLEQLLGATIETARQLFLVYLSQQPGETISADSLVFST